MRHGLDAGRIPRQTARETDAERQARFDAVRDYLQDQYLASYQEYTQGIQARRAQDIQEEPMAPWQRRQLPSHARARWIDSQHVQQFDRDDYVRPQAGPEWPHHKGQEHLFNIGAITDASFLARDPQKGDVLST